MIPVRSAVKWILLQSRPLLQRSGVLSLARRMAIGMAPGRRHRLSRIIDPAGANGTVEVVFDGVRILVNPAESLGRDLAYRLDCFEVFEMELFRNLVHQGDNVMDVGANIGLYSVLAAQKAGSGEVHAFEPNPSCFSLLIRNLAQFGPRSAQAHQIAVGANVGTVDFHCAADSAYSGVVDTRRSPTSHIIKIPVSTVDSMMTEWGLARLDLLKVDVEGYEPEVLTGAKDLLSRDDAPLLMIEISRLNLGARGIHQLDILRRLESLGYQVMVAAPGLEPVQSLDWSSGSVPQENFIAAKPFHAHRLERWIRKG